MKPSNLLRILVGLALALSLSSTVWATPPAQIPVQGVLADAEGLPIDATYAVHFVLYSDAAGQNEVWSENQNVVFEGGFFSAYLGAVTPVDLVTLRDNHSLYLGIAVDGDAEMDLIHIATAPFAAYAEFAAEAASLEGFTAADFALTAHEHSWHELTDVPADADPDPTNEYNLTAELSGTNLLISDGGGTLTVPLAALTAGLDVNDADSNPTNEHNISAALVGTNLVITDGGGSLTVPLAALRDGVNDADADPANELITAASLSGTNLLITDAGGTRTISLASLQDGVIDADANPSNELNQSLTLTGTDLILTDAGGAKTVSLAGLGGGADLDADPTNELITSASLVGTNLLLVDAGGTQTVALGSLVNDADASITNELLTSASLVGTDLLLVDAGGTKTVRLVSLVNDADASPTNELLTSASLVGTNLLLVDAGGTKTVALASLQDGVNDADASPTNELNMSVALAGTTLQLTDAGGVKSVNLVSLQDGVNDADANPTNELNTSISLSGTVLTLNDAGGPLSVNLSSLQDGVNDADANPSNELNTAFSLVGTSLQLTDAAGMKSASLASIAANPTDELQNLSLADGVLSLSSGNSVDLNSGNMMLAVNLGTSENDLAFTSTLTGDDFAMSATLPFAVKLGGVDYTNVYITTNGWIEFGPGPGSSDWTNDCLPSSAHTGPMVAAYWDDLEANLVSWGVEGTAPNRVYIINWDTYLRLSPTDEVDFQVQLHEGSNAINVKYFGVTPNSLGQSATIGYQAAGGASAKTYPISCNARVLNDDARTTDRSDQGWSITPMR